MTRLAILVWCIWLAFGGRVAAQEVPGFDWQRSFRVERIGDSHWKLVGAVEIESRDTKFYADEMDVYTDRDLMTASGNVVFVSEGSRISADRVEFNTRTKTGVFHNASGSATLGERADRSMFGSLEPDAYFYGETIEKIGHKKYRITRGGFTSCVQPTPRWEITSSSVVLTLDEYAFVRNPLLKVKGVPVFYAPALYYPINRENRSTGFLLPVYGTSTFRGQAISNAFFWAMGRSHDTTLFHDWYSRTGQGMGAEYRYVLGPGSEGQARTYFLNEHEAMFESGGTTTTTPARRSYEIRGSGTQTINRHLRARGRVDYFSDITVQQTYHQNIYDASRRQRMIGANVNGVWGVYNLSGTFERNETFFGETNSTLYGGAPRISFNRSERPIGRLPLYVSVGSEYVNLLRRNRAGTREVDNGLTRLHASPTLRVPFTRWPFLTLNSTMAWRGTFWSESLDEQGVQREQSIGRRYFDLQSQVTGPVLTRIFNTPGNRYAERFKHVIEPVVTFQRTTAIDNFDQIVKLEGLDSIVGSTTRIAYGLTNRFYARRREGGAASVAREFLNVAVAQSYYTDPRFAQFDRQFGTSFSGTPPSHFSPVALVARIAPTNELSGSLRAEYDTQFGALRTIHANGSVAVGTWLQASGGWSQRRFIEELPGFNDRSRLDHNLNASTHLRTPGNRVGGNYLFNYDLLRDRFLQQRVVGYYNAQCCGFSVEFQTFNYAGLGSRAPIPQDRRFNFSFTLAGLGTFSNFFGALGAQESPR